MTRISQITNDTSKVDTQKTSIPVSFEWLDMGCCQGLCFSAGVQFCGKRQVFRTELDGFQPADDAFVLGKRRNRILNYVETENE